MQTTIRAGTAADAHGIAQAHVASWRTSYRGILPETFLAGLSVERREAFWSTLLINADQPGVILVAEQEPAGIVGIASADPPREPFPNYDAELHPIYLLEAYQRGGLGRSLAGAIARALLMRGHRSLLLWVFAENEARHFYATLGGQVIAAAQEDFDGVMKDKQAYGWPELAVLTG